MSHAVVHLLGAVEDVDHNTERSTEVFGSLSLACASRSSGCTAHCQMQRLRQRYVAPDNDNRTRINV